MNEKAYKVLEYDKIISLLKDQACSGITKKVVEKLRPSVKLHLIEESLAETTEAVEILLKKGTPPLGDFYDIAGLLNLANKGGVLTMKQLLQVLYNVQVAGNVVRFLKGDLETSIIIKEIIEVISIQKNIEDNIDRCILSEDEMADNASPKLKDIRRSINRQNESIRSKMNQLVSSADNKGLLQDSIVTIRQGRYVIPVKQEHKVKFPGIVHDQSSTGATLFIEPQAIVTMNNELREFEVEEKREMERILAELSAEIAEVYRELLNNQELLVKLDFIFAKGKLSLKQKAESPEINKDGYIKILQGRHPLLNKERVVPINVNIGKDYHTLIITGPNTGGKTVTLKTVGLFAMMVQSGLHIPASSGTKMPIFEKIFADIGDEQSIEQSLSTFSSHMNNIVEIVGNSQNSTLVLLDELGAGTDPTEGAALAISILEDLYSKGANTIATTHYTELKKYALSTEGVENASMEFNVETLSPTYRLTIGTPGKSNAFEIAKKLGLNNSIIEKAKTLLDKGDIQFEDVISKIEKDKVLAENERDEAIALNISIKKQKEEIDNLKKKLNETRENIINKARAEAKDLVNEAKDLAKQAEKELRELSKVEPVDRYKRLEEVKAKIKKTASKHTEKQEVIENPMPLKKSEAEPGQRVKVLNLNQKGELISYADDKGEVMVQVGNIKINCKVENLMKIQGGKDSSKEKNKYAAYGQLYRNKTMNILPTVNVRGQNLDNAIMDVDKYLDDAYMAGLKSVTVIHGRGEGVLREGLQELFRSHKHVSKFHKGAYNEGGDGVTIVEIK